jgi:hypothetical protein
MLAPKRAARPRQEETFFILLVPNGTVKAQASTYEALAKQAAEIYFRSSGGITGGLRETLTQLNQGILAEQKKIMQPLRVSLICVVLHENEIYLARSGPMMAVFRQGKTLTTFPRNRSEESLNLAPPLGATMEPRVELSHFELTPGCMVLLADGLNRASDEQLSAVLLAHDDIEDVLDPLRQLVDVPLGHVMVVQFVTEDTPTPETASVSEPAPVLPVPEAPSIPPPPAPEEPTPVVSEQLIPEQPASAEPEIIIPESPEQTEKRSSPMIRTLARTLSGVASTTSKVGGKIFPATPASSEGQAVEESADNRIPWLSNLAVLLALIIPLVVIVVVVGLALRPPDDSAYEICRQDVLARQAVARGLTPKQGEPLDTQKADQAREQWLLVRDEALACEREKPGDREMREVAGDAQNHLDRFDRVTRRDVLALRRFREGADLHGPVSGNWITLYTLDRANDEVYQDTLSTDGLTLVEVSDTPLIFKGQNIAGTVIGDLIDIEWMERGGLPAGNANVPIALEETGLLIWHNETFGENEVMQLVLPATWNQPQAMAVWRLNLYILDPAGQQIWRYVPNEGVYSDVPEEYFSGEDRPDLTGAIDLGIDEDGSIYVLYTNGTIKKFRGGVEQPFDVFNLPQGALTTANSLFVDNNPISRGLVVTDPEKETLYTMSLGGTVNIGYRPLNQLDAFDRLSGAIVNPETNNIYVLAGSFLYQMRRQ